MKRTAKTVTVKEVGQPELKTRRIYILKLGLNNISAGTVDYTDGEDRRPNLLKGHSSVKSEAHESLVRG